MPSDSPFGSFAFTAAPYSTSIRTASALPVFAQVISGVSPVAMGVFGLAPDFSSDRTSAEFPLVQASDSGVIAKFVGGVCVGTGAEQQIRRFHVIPMRQPKQRRRAVAGPGIDVNLLGEERANGLLVLVSGSLDQPRIARLGGVRQPPQPAAISSVNAPAFMSASEFQKSCQNIEPAAII